MKPRIFAKTTACIRTSLAAILVGSSLILSAEASSQAAGPLESALTASAITLDETGTEIATPATAIEPGGVIEYVLTYANVSGEPLGALAINGPIPEQTRFLGGSASIDKNANFEARAEGVDWSIPPLVRYEEDEQGVLQPVEVAPEEYAEIRWRFQDDLAPDETIQLTYRVLVEQ